MHIWIIMDWNRRWAKQKWVLKFSWHKAWFEKAKNILEKIAQKKEITHLTLWALSKENLLKRDKEELSWLIQLIDKFYDFLPLINENNICFTTIWDIEKLPQKTQDILENIKKETQNNTWLVFNVALVYSWQDETIRWIKKLVKSWFDIEKLDEKKFREFLDTAFLPPVDLIIRTWWDIRHSWFCLYDSAYREYYFTETFWPDFSMEELEKAINIFNKTERRFWK